MTCEQLIGFLDDYLGGDVDAARRAEFDAHLAECPACVAYVAQYRAVIEVGRRVDSPHDVGTLPPGLVAAVRRAIRADDAPPKP